MISKQKLVRFINKYYLNGTVGSAVFNSKTNNQQGEVEVEHFRPSTFLTENAG